MDIKTELAQCKEENGRLREFLIETFNELETISKQVGIVETAVINSDIGTEMEIIELSEMTTNVMLGINNEVPQYTSMFKDYEDF